jgi:membrane-associated phospholipid phosphatase
VNFRFRPLEILNLVACGTLLLLCVACGAAGRLPAWPGLAVQYAAMAAGVLGVAWLARRPRVPPPLVPVVDLYPVLFVPLVFDSLGRLIPAVNPAADPGRDDWLVAADRFLFGTDPTVWLERFVRPWLTDGMYVAYYLYFVVPFVVAAYLWRRRGLAAFRRYVFVVALSFFVSYVGYFLVPAKGPRVALEPVQTIKLRDFQATPFARALADAMNFVERNKNDVFPSGHVMLTAVCLLLALRESRRLFLLLLPVGLGVFVSTVYCRYHYVIDVIAGLLLALPMPAVGRRAYERLGGEAAAVGEGNGATGWRGDGTDGPVSAAAASRHAPGPVGRS